MAVRVQPGAVEKRALPRGTYPRFLESGAELRGRRRRKGRRCLVEQVHAGPGEHEWNLVGTRPIPSAEMRIASVATRCETSGPRS